MARRLSTYVLLLFFVLGACPHRLDAGQRRAVRIAPASALLPAEAAWSVTLPSPPSATGAIDAQGIYIPLESGQLVSLDRDTGLVRWSVAIESRFPPVAGGDAVYVGGKAELQALSPATGTPIWTAALGGELLSPLVVADSSIVLITAPGHLRALNRADGREKWTSPIDVGTETAHLAADRSRVCASSGGHLTCHALADGAREWDADLPGRLSTPTLSGDLVLVGSTDNSLYALTASNGGLSWKWRFGGDVVGATVDRDIVYVASLDHLLRALRAGSGNQIWKRQLSTTTLAPPDSFGGIVVVPGNQPMLATFNAVTGAPIASLPSAGRIEGVPLVDRSLRPFQVSIVAVTRGGRVAAFRSTGMMFREPDAVPLSALPGRALNRETLSGEGVR